LEGITEDVEGLICKDCVVKLPFLRAYGREKEFDFVNCGLEPPRTEKGGDQRKLGEIGVRVIETNVVVVEDEEIRAIEDQEPAQKTETIYQRGSG